MLETTRRPLHKEIAEVLSERILSGQYPEQSLLPPERVLCQEHRVSRTVIREAIQCLESRGLVRIDRGRGTRVAAARHDLVTDSLKLMLRRKQHTMEQLLEVRKVLETGMVALAAQRRTDEDLARMSAALELMRRNPGEPAGYVDADLEFHAAIAGATRNPVLLTILEPLAELLRQSRVATFSGEKTVKVRTRQHEQVFQRIRDRDAAGAQAAMFHHLSDTEGDLRRHQGSDQGRQAPGEGK
jgi:GntR family transcriptional repressor for pyruvate dehydrogenase complex